MENISLDSYIEALSNTGCSDNTKLKQASEFIELAKEKPGFCEAMMKIASDPKYRPEGGFDVNLAAAIQLKNMVQYHWKHSDGGRLNEFNDDDIEEEDEEETKSIIISQEDKDFVKEYIIKACAHAPSFAVLALLEEIVHVVARYEMPSNWPNVMTEITELLGDTDEGKLFGGLTALKEVVHRFEFEFRENRVPLDEIVDTLFPTLETMFVTLMDNMEESAMKAKNIIMDTLFLANNAKICKRYQNEENFNSLMSVALKSLTQEIPEEFTTKTENTDEIDKLVKSEHWKLKKRCITLLNRILIQLSNIDEEEEELNNVSKNFFEHHAKDILDISFLLIELSLTKFVSNDVVSLAVRIVNRAEKVPDLFAVALLKHEDIVFKYCLPLLMLTPHDIEEFTENPISYTRGLYSLTHWSSSVRSYAIDMMNDFVTYKDEGAEGVPPMLGKFLNYLAETLSNPIEDFKLKESIMLAIGYLSPHISPYEDLHQGVEDILKNYIFPDLQGENEFLKARALWLYGEMPNFVKDPQHAIEAVSNIYK